MEIETASLDYSSDIDSDDVFMGPITKREIVARLKYYKILSEAYLEPINDLKNTDTVDEDLVAFYWNIFTARENMASEDPTRNKSIYQDLEQRKSLYHIETSAQNLSTKRDNTPAESFQTENCDEKSESYDDSLIRSRNSLVEPQCNDLKNDSPKNIYYDSIDKSHNITNSSIYEQNDDQSIIIISDDSLISNESKNETLEELQIKVEDITKEENELQLIEEQISSSLKLNNEIFETEKQVVVQDVQPIENMSILSDTFISKNSDLENYCPSSQEQDVVADDDDDDCFNDTLEEMEMLMKFGENYMEQKQDTASRDAIETNSNISNVSEGYNETEEIYEKISKQQSILQMDSPNTSKYFSKSGSCTPASKQSKSDIQKQSKTPSVFKPHHSTESNFKVPIKVPSARKSPNYKSIVSPISLYIKNSPKVPLIKKVANPTIHSSIYRELDQKNSCEKVQENFSESHQVLPIRTYKLAAKNIFLSKENEPRMPNNIRKLIKGPLNPEIIKHVGRVKATTTDLPLSPSTNFTNNVDLTILSSTSASEGIFNISTAPEGDVSLYISKNAARTNFSTK